MTWPGLLPDSATTGSRTSNHAVTNPTW